MKRTLLFGLLAVVCVALWQCKKDNKSGDEYPLLPVKDVTAASSDKKVDLAWTAPDSKFVKSYKITWTPGNGSGTVAVGTNKFSATGLTNGTEYTFSVVAVYDRGTSSAQTIKATPKASDFNDVTNLQAKPGNQKITLKWTVPVTKPGTTLTGYKVSLVPTDVSPLDIKDPAVTGITINNLKNGTKYTVTVISVYKEGESNGVTALCTPTEPVYNDPREVKAEAQNQAIDLSWAAPVAPADEDLLLAGYTISVNPADHEPIIIKDTTVKKQTIADLKNGVEYTVTILANYSDGGASKGVQVTSTPFDNRYAPCTDVKATAANQAITLAWTAPKVKEGTELAGYVIKVSPEDLNPIDVEKTATSFTIKPLKNGVEYTVSIFAKYTDNNLSIGASDKATPKNLISGEIKAYTGKDVLGNVSYIRNSDNSIDAWFMKATPLKVQSEKHMYNATGWWYAILEKAKQYGDVEYALSGKPLGMKYYATIAYTGLCLRVSVGSPIQVTIYPWVDDYATSVLQNPIIDKNYTPDNEWLYILLDDEKEQKPENVLPAGDYLVVFKSDSPSAKVWVAENQPTDDPICVGFVDGQLSGTYASLSYNGIYKAYIGWNEREAKDYSNAVRMRSTDGGQTWSAPKSILTLNVAKLRKAEGMAQYAKNLCITQANNTYYMAVSNDRNQALLASSPSYYDWSFTSDETVASGIVGSMVQTQDAILLYYLKNSSQVWVASAPLSNPTDFREIGQAATLTYGPESIAVAYNEDTQEFILTYAMGKKIKMMTSKEGTANFTNQGDLAEGVSEITYATFITNNAGKVNAPKWISFLDAEKTIMVAPLNEVNMGR